MKFKVGDQVYDRLMGWTEIIRKRLLFSLTKEEHEFYEDGRASIYDKIPRFITREEAIAEGIKPLKRTVECWAVVNSVGEIELFLSKKTADAYFLATNKVAKSVVHLSKEIEIEVSE